ncbi:MAG TPA: hypothetical protein DEB32_10830 [Stenotrophomonas sp.]|uniref:hypothetical protein n=1 Tax=Stenotrophomonas sp. TaxID=69392 RepID=UPI000E8F8E9E|nr:hypothetical protein [Stenotrophomonas sp.]HBS63189.1 hypothetical protein [Stenotrophomonas sp.]
MTADWNISRNDSEADRADSERAEWIAERAAVLEAEYAADPKKVEEAVADFFLADEGSLVTNLTTFFLEFRPPYSAFALHDQIKQQIAPILREYAEDAATAERNQIEAADETDRHEQRDAA